MQMIDIQSYKHSTYTQAKELGIYKKQQIFFKEKTKKKSDILRRYEFFFAYISRIYGIIHDLLPAFEGCNLKERNVGMTHMVKSDLGVDPFSVILVQTLIHVWDDFSTDLLTRD